LWLGRGDHLPTTITTATTSFQVKTQAWNHVVLTEGGDYLDKTSLFPQADMTGANWMDHKQCVAAGSNKYRPFWMFTVGAQDIFYWVGGGPITYDITVVDDLQPLFPDCPKY